MPVKEFQEMEEVQKITTTGGGVIEMHTENVRKVESNNYAAKRPKV